MKQHYYEHEKCLFFCPYPMLGRMMTYVDIREHAEDEYPYLLKKLINMEDAVFEWKIGNHAMYGNACVVSLTIRKKDYTEILNLVKNLPAKVQHFCGAELYEEYERAVCKIYDILDS